MTHEEDLVARYMNGWATYVLDQHAGTRRPVLFLPRTQSDAMPWITAEGAYTRHASHEVFAEPAGNTRRQRCDICGGLAHVAVRPSPDFLPWGQCADCLIEGLDEEMCLLENHANTKGENS